MTACHQCVRCGGHFQIGGVDYFTGLCRYCRARPILSRVKAAMKMRDHYRQMAAAENKMERMRVFMLWLVKENSRLQERLKEKDQ